MREYRFFLDMLFRNNCDQAFFDSITNKFTGQAIYRKNIPPHFANGRDTSCFSDIPDYLEPHLLEGPKVFKTIKAPLYKGYLVDLSLFKNVEDYLKNHVGKARYSQLRRYKKRLDLCIAPRYVAYFGKMDETEYHSIFQCLKDFTKRRFRQKKEVNYEIPYLDYYEEIMYPMILEKRALIYVIYDGKKPISITLNFVFGDLLLHWNSCYDIDYGIFNVGHINAMEHFRWSFDHHIKTFEMSRGDFWHKQRLVNRTFLYEKHILYRATSLKSICTAYLNLFWPFIRYHIIQNLKKVRAQKLYSLYARRRFRKFNPYADIKEMGYELHENPGPLPPVHQREPIRIADEVNSFLRAPFNQFLHGAKISHKETEVFKLLDSSNTYFIASEAGNLQINVLP